MNKKQMLEIAEAVKADAGVVTFVPLAYENRYEARSHVRTKLLVSPIGDTAEGLTILAHEAGHLATTKVPDDIGERMDWLFGLNQTVPTELEATRWGFHAIRRHGGKTTEEMEASARVALASYVPRDEANGYPISAEARAFISGDLDL